MTALCSLVAVALSAVLLAPQGAKKPAAPEKTLGDIMASFDDQSTKAQKDIQEKRFAAIETYLAAKTPPADRADALAAAAELGHELEKWEKACGHADKYLAEFKTGESAADMQLLRARCLANLPGKTAAAKEAFAAALAAAGDNINAGVSAGTELASFLADSGDIEGAKKTLDELVEKYAKAQGLKQYLQSQKDDLAAIGTDPKPIDVKGLDGKPINLAAYKGKVVLLDFWAMWCGPCMAELPNVVSTYKKYHDKGFDIVGISLDRDKDEAKLKAFVVAKGMPWAQFYDGKFWENAVAVDYGIHSIPATFLLDKEGKIVRKGLRGASLGRAIEKLLSNAATPAPAGGPKKS